MREIKFRAWDKENKGYIVEPVLIGESKCFIWRGNNVVEVPNVEIIQYTGLKGKNGKEIYEGDIFEYFGGKNGTGKRTVFEVIWNNSTFSFCLQTKNGNRNPLKSIYMKPSRFHLIGNIYENPELLK